MLVYNGSAWVPPTRYRTWGGAFFVDGFPWVYTDAWHQLVPPNAIMLYKSITNCGPEVRVCDGTLWSYDLRNRYIYGASTSIMSAGGTSTHAGHGYSDAGGIDSSLRTHNIVQAAGAIVSYASSSDYAHRHLINVHQHSSTASNSSPLNNLECIATMGGDNIYQNAIIMNTAQLSGIYSYISDVINNYIVLSNRYLETNATIEGTHNHGTVSLTTGPARDSGGSALTRTGYASYYSATSEYGWDDHIHTGSHTDADTDLLPSYYTIVPNLLNSNIYFDELPSGTIMIFTSTYLPPGWTRLSAADSRLLRTAAVSGSTGGSSTHTHNPTISTSGYTVTTDHTNGLRRTDYGPSGAYLPSVVSMTHSHTWVDAHTTSQSHMPLYYRFYIGVKS